ncbi:MAG: primosomal protein N' [Bacillota bacterium]
MDQYAEIIIDLISDAVDRPFHYRILPDLQGLVKPGAMVTVPFGNRAYQGFVMRLLKQPDVTAVRDIAALAGTGPLLNREQLALVPWMVHRYYCRHIEAIHALVPASCRQSRATAVKKVFALTPAAGQADLARAPAQRQAVELIRANVSLSREELARLGVRSETLRGLERKGLIRAFAGPRDRSPAQTGAALEPPLLLKDEQRRCYEALCGAMDEKRPRRLLLHGITASGKTEIYLQGIDRCLARGESALVLVPEIALTPQMIEMFQGRFPGEAAVLHSRLTPAEKSSQWRRISEGAARVVLGARSAVFAPLENVGLIVLDEEHETSYKQEEAPRYHAREVAWWRARYHKAVLLLGSATPSLESYHESVSGRGTLLEMASRVTPSRLPPVRIVDMREELKQGHRQIFSRPLLAALQGVLERDEQALLFLNRRGFASFVLCRECGYVVRCPACAVSLTLHTVQERMVCHYCSHQEKVPQACPSCGGTQIRHFGAGTQRVETEVQKLYPGVPTIRMDSDTTTSRGTHQRFYQAFRKGQARILIGTQMVAKGFNFPGVTLVGVVTADTALNLPDFRAAERTFQLLTQVSGRAGRGPLGGEVIVQTYHPAHYSILAAADHNYGAFYEAELENRRQLAYPPFSDLVRFVFAGADEAAVWEAAVEFTALLKPLQAAGELLGPAPAPLFRLKNYFRVHTILKGERLPAQARFIRNAARHFRARKPPRPVRLTVDFNPQVVL